MFKKHGITVTTDIGLIVKYDGVFNVYVEVSNSYRGKLSGLCGDFNGERKDEFKTPNNELVENVLTFGNSWKVDHNCPDVTSVVEHPCKTTSERAIKIKEQCSSLSKAPFSKCNRLLDPISSGHIADCKFDVCACNDPETCLCQSLASYEDECNDLGVEIKWQDLKRFSICRKYNDKISGVRNPCLHAMLYTVDDNLFKG